MTSDPSFDTSQLHAFVDRMRAGDPDAADALVRQVGGRLERLARSMLRGFPNVKRWVDTEDVVQSALMRLLRTLRAVRPESTRDFANLAALHIRRELLDLTRHFRTLTKRGVQEGNADLLAQAPVPAGLDDDLDLWAAFHEQVGQLPVKEREVVSLWFYHGWTQPQMAELFQVDERTVRRRWRAACLRLAEVLGGRLPQW
jgi:RNA polymerase sigma factor (sigma-70 family)